MVPQVNNIEHVIDSADINTGKYELELPAPAEGQQLTVTAFLKDSAPNISNSISQTYTRDTSTPGDNDQNGQADEAGKPVVTIQDALGTSGYINAEDVIDGKVSVTITFPENSGYNSGDLLYVTTTAGTLEPIELTADMIANGHTILIEPSEGVNTVSAYVSDKAGNRSLSGSDKSTLDDSVALPPVLTVKDANGDNILSQAELAANVGKAVVNIEIPAGYTEGATLNVIYPNSQTEAIVLTQQHLLYGLTVNVDVTEGNNTVQASITKASGESSKVGETIVKVDITAPNAPVVEIVGVENGYIDANDFVDGKVHVRVTLPTAGGYAVGDLLTVTDGAGTQQTHTLTQADLTNGVSFYVTPVEGNNTITATVSDAAGNTSDVQTVDAIRDNGVPITPTVYFNDQYDGSIDAADLNSDGQVGVTVSLAQNGGFSVGDVLYIEVAGGANQQIALTQDHISNGSVIVNVTPVEGENEIIAYIRDAQGNVTENASATSYYNSTAPVEQLFDTIDNSNIADVKITAGGDILTVNGDVNVDVALQAGNDQMSIAGSLNATVDGGTGTDTVTLTGSTVDADKLQNFERINLQESASETTLVLSENTVLNNHATGAVDTNGILYSNVLTIDGGVGDSVQLWSGAAQTNTIESSGQTYQVYNQNIGGTDYQVWIDSDISVK